MTRKEKAKAFRESAEYIFDSECTKYSCSVLQRHSGTMLVKRYTKIFCPDDMHIKGSLTKWYSWLDVSKEIEDDLKLYKEWRLNALCLAAAMAETGDL